MRQDRQKVIPTWSTRLSRLMVQDGMQEILARYGDVQQTFKDTQAGKGLETVREGFTAEKGYYGKLLETIIEMEYHFGYVQKNASMVIKNGVRKFASVVEQLVLIKEQQAKAVSMIQEALLKEINGKGSLKRPRPTSSPESSPGNEHVAKKTSEDSRLNENLGRRDGELLIPQNDLGKASKVAITEEEQQNIAKLQEEENRKMLQEQKNQRQQQEKEQRKREKLHLEQEEKERRKNLKLLQEREAKIKLLQQQKKQRQQQKKDKELTKKRQLAVTNKHPIEEGPPKGTPNNSKVDDPQEKSGAALGDKDAPRHKSKKERRQLKKQKKLQL